MKSSFSSSHAGETKGIDSYSSEVSFKSTQKLWQLCWSHGMDYGPKLSMHSQQPSINNQPHLITDPLCHLPNKKKKQLLLVSICCNAPNRIHSASIHEKSKYMVLIVLKSVLLSTLNTRGQIVAFAFLVMQFIYPFID